MLCECTGDRCQLRDASHRRGHHRRRHSDYRTRRLGAVSPDARGRQWPKKNVGRAVETAQRAGPIQSGPGDLITLFAGGSHRPHLGGGFHINYPKAATFAGDFELDLVAGL